MRTLWITLASALVGLGLVTITSTARSAEAPVLLLDDQRYICALDEPYVPYEPTAVPYWSYDAEEEFTDAELYMMLSANTSCPDKKHIYTVTNPDHVPVLKDHFSQNDKVLDVYFPECQFSTSHNFSQKAMVQPKDGKQRQFPVGSDVWQAFSVFVPEDYVPNSGWNLIYQHHGHPDNVVTCDQWRSPPMSISMINGGTEWNTNLRYSNVKCQRNGNADGTILREYGQPVVKGGWTHFVMHMRYDWQGDGRAEIWITDDVNADPVKIVDYSGPLGYNDAMQPYDYMSFGYYYGRTAGPDVQLYFDRIIFAGEDGNLEDLMYRGE